jgi:hypothetical protein
MFATIFKAPEFLQEEAEGAEIETRCFLPFLRYLCYLL